MSVASHSKLPSPLRESGVRGARPAGGGLPGHSADSPGGPGGGLSRGARLAAVRRIPSTMVPARSNLEHVEMQRSTFLWRVNEWKWFGSTCPIVGSLTTVGVTRGSGRTDKIPGSGVANVEPKLSSGV